jgi:hypothetical protein
MTVLSLHHKTSHGDNGRRAAGSAIAHGIFALGIDVAALPEVPDTAIPLLILQQLRGPEYIPGQHARLRSYWQAKFNGKLRHLADNTIVVVSDAGIYQCDRMESLFNAQDAGNVPELTGCVDVLMLNHELHDYGESILVATESAERVPFGGPGPACGLVQWQYVVSTS